MPIPNHEDSKEIRLFGEKSIKEEAYRQKILQLEKEIMELGSKLDNGQKQPEKEIPAVKESYIKSEPSEKNFHEVVSSLNEKVKKHEYIVDLKIKHINEKLGLQARDIVEQHKARSEFKDSFISTRKTIAILTISTCIGILVAAAGFVYSYKLSNIVYNKKQAVLNSYENPANIKEILQSSGFYKNQYTIINMDYHNQQYKGVVELHFMPYDKWALKMLAADIIDNFKRISLDKSMELNFIYENNMYAKIAFSPVADSIHYEFYTPKGDE